MNSKEGKTTLVLGASENPERYSNMAVKLLNNYGHPVTAIGRKDGMIGDIKIETLSNCYKNSQFDTITLYLNPKNQVPWYEEIIRLKPKRVIFNPGTENPALEEILDKNGIGYEEACTLVLLRSNQY